MFAGADIMLDVRQAIQARLKVMGRSGRPMDTIRVLIVDDHPGVRDALQVSLSKLPGLDVMASVGDLDTVVSAIDEVEPDVVVVEPKSLHGEGLQTCSRILAAKSSPAVIVLTSYRTEKEATILSEMGVSRYLLKDIDSQRLYEEILESYAERRAGEGVASGEED